MTKLSSLQKLCSSFINALHQTVSWRWAQISYPKICQYIFQKTLSKTRTVKKHADMDLLALKRKSMCFEDFLFLSHTWHIQKLLFISTNLHSLGIYTLFAFRGLNDTTSLDKTRHVIAVYFIEYMRQHGVVSLMLYLICLNVRTVFEN